MLDNTMLADAIVCVIAIGCLIAAVLILKANKAAYESGYEDGYLDALDERKRNGERKECAGTPNNSRTDAFAQ